MKFLGFMNYWLLKFLIALGGYELVKWISTLVSPDNENIVFYAGGAGVLVVMVLMDIIFKGFLTKKSKKGSKE